MAPIEKWVEIARTIFPEDAQITHPPAGESVWMKVRWRIHTDPRRPNKPARGVNVYFTREFCNAYRNLDVPCRVALDEQVKRTLVERYTGFNPDHNAPHGAPMPMESWFIAPAARG